jgi:hypothetical protein
LVGQSMSGMKLFQINKGLVEKELMARKKTRDKPHGDFRVLITDKFTIELQTLKPQSETTLIVGDGFVGTLEDLVGGRSVEGRSASAIDIGKMKTEEVVEDGKTITSDGLFADGATKDGSSGSAVTGNNGKDAMQAVAEGTVMFHPMLAIRPFRMIAIGHDGGINRGAGKIDVRVERGDLREKTRMEASRLQLSAKETVKKH